MTEHMEGFLKSRLGKSLKVHRKGPESRVGTLLDANNEFLTLLTEEDGVIYYKTHHVKSYTHNAKGEEDKNSFELPEDFKYFKANNFSDLLTQMQHCWVIVNHGPEKFEGVLSNVDGDWVTVVNKNEVVRLSTFHIKNISYGNNPFKSEEEEGKEKEEKQEKEGK